MTQALALRALLEAAGHRVCSVLVGRSTRRVIPDYFLQKIDAPVHAFESPNFVVDADERAVRPGQTLLRNLGYAGRFRDSIRLIAARIRRDRPDVLINFFEPLAGLYQRRARPGIPMVCIGHQYVYTHPDYALPPGRRWERRGLLRFIELTAAGADRRLALSFYPLSDVPAQRLVVVPPLLRSALLERIPELPEPFLLVYLLNSGYADAVIRWHERHPEVPLHCFWDRKGVPPTYRFDARLTFHTLDDRKFLALMVRCRGVVCTAGFESVCEAFYLGKPVQMVPVEGHYEQYCNALDAVRAGAGLYSLDFNLDKLKAQLPAYYSPDPAFRRWVAEAGARCIAEIEAVARTQGRPSLIPV